MAVQTEALYAGTAIRKKELHSNLLLQSDMKLVLFLPCWE